MISNESAPAVQRLIAQGLHQETRMSVRPAKPGQLMNTAQGDVIDYGNGRRAIDVGNGAQNLLSMTKGYDPEILRSETSLNLSGLRVETAVRFSPSRPHSASVQALDSPEIVETDGVAAYGSITDSVAVYP